MSKKSNPGTYQRLLRNIVRDISELQPDSDPKLRERLDKRFKKYLPKANIKNGPAGDQNN